VLGPSNKEINTENLKLEKDKREFSFVISQCEKERNTILSDLRKQDEEQMLLEK
jgi:hypothetical protein